MLAVDTNVVVRYLVGGENEQQAKKARGLVDGHRIFVPTTVILESEWVLRSVYGFERSRVREALKAFVQLASVDVDDAVALNRAFDLAEEGLDFADALHVTSSARAEAFVTFDKDLIKAAKTLSGPSVRAP